MSEKNTKGIPKKATRRRAKPCGVMVRYGGGPSIIGESLACVHAAKKSL